MNSEFTVKTINSRLEFTKTGFCSLFPISLNSRISEFFPLLRLELSQKVWFCEFFFFFVVFGLGRPH